MSEILKETKKDPSSTFEMDGWKLYSYENPPQGYDSYLKDIKNADAEGKSVVEVLPEGGDEKRLKSGDNLIRLIAEKKMNHHYKIYKDWAFGGTNREILTCDGKWICVELNNFGVLMAYADYLERNEKFGVFEKLEKDICWLRVHVEGEHCLHCPHS